MLSSHLTPYCTALDYPPLSPEGLRITALTHGFQWVFNFIGCNPEDGFWEDSLILETSRPITPERVAETWEHLARWCDLYEAKAIQIIWPYCDLPGHTADNEPTNWPADVPF